MKRDGSVDHMDELLVAFLIAAISGPERERFVGDLVQFDLKTGKIIQEIIERKWDEVKDIAISSPAIPSDIDLELEFEARHAALLKHKNDLEKEKDRLSQLLKEANNRIERLRDNHDHMQAELLDAKDQLTKLTKDGDTTQVIEHLQKRLHEQDTLIDNLELQCEENRKERVKMTEQASEYLIQIARIQPLMAELKDVKQELNRMGELRQKVINAENKATNLARKLESQQDWQAENDQLTQENEELAARLNDYELLKRENNSLRAGQESYTRLVHTQEADIAESNRQRIIIEEKLAAAEAAVTRLEEFKMHDEKYIKDMEEERTGVVDDLDTSDSPTNTAGLNLEEELQEEKAGTQQSLELSRLRAEIRVLKSNDAGVQEILTLRKLLDEAERAKKQVSEKYQDIYEKYVIQQQQITAILNAATSEGSVEFIDVALLVANKLTMLTPEYHSDVAFRDLRKALADITEALRGSERKRLDAEAELENTKRDLVIARTDCKLLLPLIPCAFADHALVSAIPQGDLDALEALKSSQETVTSSLDNELKALQNRYKSLETDFDLQKDQLTDVILAKDDLQKTSVERAKSLALLEEKDNKKENEKLKDSIEEKNRQVSTSAKKPKRKSYLQSLWETWSNPSTPTTPTTKAPSKSRNKWPTSVSAAVIRSPAHPSHILLNSSPVASSVNDTDFIPLPPDPLMGVQAEGKPEVALFHMGKEYQSYILPIGSRSLIHLPLSPIFLKRLEPSAGTRSP